MFRRGFQSSAPLFDDGHGIFRGDELQAMRLSVDLSPTKTRKNQRLLSRNQMRSIQLGRNVHGQTTASQSLGGVFRVGCCRKKVAAERKEHFGIAVVHRLNSMHCIKTMFSGRAKSKFLFQAVEELIGRL